MKSRVIVWLAGICLILIHCSGVLAATEKLQEISPVYTKQPIKLDGIINEPAWKNAAQANLLHYTKRTPLKEATQAKLLYDKDNLYVAFICHESRMKDVFAVITTENGGVFTDDCVEIMLSPDETAGEDKYIHFVGNILGTRYTARDGMVINEIPWKIKTQRQKNSWTAEITIPLNAVKDAALNTSYWRINLFREEYPHQENSSWAPTSGTFHSPALFGKLSGINLNGKFIGLTAPVVPLKGDVSGPATYRLEQATAPREFPSIIIPKPVKFTLNGSDFLVNSSTRIVLADNPSDGNIQAANEINEELKEQFGIELPIITVADKKAYGNKNLIILGEAGKHKLVDAFLNVTSEPKTNFMTGDEGYTLRSSEFQVMIIGNDPAGTYYGVQSLKQLFRNVEGKPGAVKVLGASVWDKPAFKIRSALISLDKDSPTIHKKMIAKIFARYKINHLIMEVENGIAFKSCPEIGIRPVMSVEDAKDLVQYAKQHFIQSTPLLQSLGHCEWIFRYDKHFDICEDTTIPYAYCPLNPKSYEFMFPVIDETLEIFDHPEYMHIGHDEVDMLGRFPKHDVCKSLGSAELVYRDTVKIHDYLKTKNVKTMMWGDILLKPYFAKHIDLLPKDILMCDWHYDPATTQRSVDFFQDRGFQVLGSAWYDPVNISGFAQYCNQKKSLGMMDTIWAGFHNNKVIVRDYNFQVAAYILSADYWWNPEGQPIQDLKYSPSDVLDLSWYGKEAHKPVQVGFSVNLNPYVNFRLEDKGDNAGFLNAGKGSDLSGLVQESVNGKLHLLDDVNYQLASINDKPVGILLKGNGLTSGFPEKVESIKIGKYADELYFLHTSLYSAPTGTQVGQYVIHYVGGYSVTVPLIYGVNIGGWLDRETYYGGNLAWQGKTAQGKPVYVKKMKWENNKLHKRIETIDFISTQPEVSLLLMGITGGAFRE